MIAKPLKVEPILDLFDFREKHHPAGSWDSDVVDYCGCLCCVNSDLTIGSLRQSPYAVKGK